jgi:dTMP kinase
VSPAARGGEGLFITLEGGEGAGKSTQAELLKQSLEARGRRVVQLREPGGTRLGEDLRQLLLTNTSIAARTELLLFIAARSELVDKVIKPALKGGLDVICDRFVDSTVAYQGYGRGLDLGLIRTLNAAAIDGCLPDLTVFLDIDPDLGLSRGAAAAAGDRIEGHWQAGFQMEEQAASSGKRVGGRDKAFHRRVHRGYVAIAKEEPERWLVIDATLPPSLIAGAIDARLQALIDAR